MKSQTDWSIKEIRAVEIKVKNVNRLSATEKHANNEKNVKAVKGFRN